MVGKYPFSVCLSRAMLLKLCFGHYLSNDFKFDLLSRFGPYFLNFKLLEQNVKLIVPKTGLPRSGKKVWKMKFFPGQGKVREFQL